MIFRTKNDRIEISDEFGHLAQRQSVFPAEFSARTQIPQLQLIFPLFIFIVQDHLGKILLVGDVILLLGCPMGAPLGKKVDTLQGVGLSLGVISAKKIDSRRKGNICACNVPEILIAHSFQNHFLIFHLHRADHV